MARGKKKKPPQPAPKAKAPSFRPFAEVAKDLKAIAVASEVPHSKPESVSPEEPSDEELLRAALGDVRPLAKRDRVAPVRKPPQPSVEHYDEDAEALAKLAGMLDGTEPLGHEHGEEHTEWIADDVDRGLLARLVAGEFPAQAHVDLHGMTREQAHAAVVRFLADARIRRLRCVLVVHGRGHHSEGSIPVLKLSVQRWLRRGVLKTWVFAFATARPVDGGPGAMYVMLRDAG